MKKELAEALVIRRKMFIVLYAKDARNIRKACQEFGVPRSSFYRWKKSYEKEGVEGLIRKKPIAKSHPRQLPPEVVEKILYLRRTYHLGPQRITWYLERYHGVKTSCSSVYRTLVRNGMRRLPKKVRRRAIHTLRYAKKVPGHHIQVDVKFLSLKTNNDKKVRTDRGHEFQAQFHWHVEDKRIRHVYIKPRSPQLNGKVERSHRSDQEEFYQLLTYIDDVDLNMKLSKWEQFYNFNRPHGAFNGKTPYEALRCMLK